MSGHKSMAKITNDSATAAVTETLSFTIYEESKCSEEYNPLLETDHMGRVLMYQDSNRGSITDVVPTAANTFDVVLKDLCINLTGHNGVMGRSILVTSDDSNNASLGVCCAIRYEAGPDAVADATHHHHNSHSNYGHGGHGYGGYGGYGQY